MTRAFDVGPKRLMVKAPKPNSNARGTDMITRNQKVRQTAVEDNKAMSPRKTIKKVSATENNLVKNLGDDIKQLRKDARGKGVPRALQNEVLPDLQNARRNVKRYIDKNLSKKPGIRRRQLQSVKHSSKISEILAKKGVYRSVTTEGAGKHVRISKKMKAKGHRQE